MLRNLGIRVLVLASMLYCLFPVHPAIAQDAQLSGVVLDPQKAAVPRAEVTAVNTNTGVKRVTTTNEQGIYVIPALLPGTYEILVQASGFETATVENVIFNVGQNAALDFDLKLGAPSTKVVVDSGAVEIDTTDATVSTVIDRQFVENMPLNGRSFQSLIALSPGVVVTPSAETSEQGQLSVAGQRAGSNYFTIDGVSANFAAPQTRWGGQANNGGLLAFSAIGSTNSLVSVDALEEFRLESSTYAPEFGRESGAQIVLVTRSGTNRFHGTAFDYFRNDVLDANDWFANSTAQPKPRERQNDFGAVFGGPLLKDRTFFFFSYEGLRVSQPIFQILDVPSLGARANAAPDVKALIDAFPLPNGPATGPGLNQLAASAPNKASLDATSIRIDHTFNSKVNLFGRYNRSPSSETAVCGFTLSQSCLKQVAIDTATVGVTASFTPSITNDFHFNFSRERAESSFVPDSFGGATPPPLSSLFPSFATPAASFAGFFILAGRGVGLYDGKYSDHVNRQLQFVDSIEVARGSHVMKFGFDFRRITPDEARSTPSYFDWNYGGDPMPAFISGAPPDYAEIDQIPTSPRFRFHNFSSFAQDTWKVSRRFTLTYGLRWDYNPPPTEATGNTYAFSQVTDIATATLLPRGSTLWHADWKNFGPRLGASYMLRRSAGRPTVLRAGFGQFYDLGTATAGFLDNGYGWFPYSVGTVLCNFGTGPDCAGSVPYSGPQPSSAFTQPYKVMRAFNRDLELPYSLEWSVAVEQALSRNDTFKLSYIGSAGRNLLKDNVYSNPNPIVSSLYLTTNNGYSNFEGLELQYQRRLSRGLQALVSYSWSHSSDTNSSDISQVGSGAYVSPPSGIYNVRQDYGDSDFDIRHSFSAAVTYNLPLPNIRNSFARALIQNWSLDGLTSARTGTPFDVEYNPANPGTYTDGQGDVFPFRPDVVPGQPIWIHNSSVPGGKELNPAAFSIPSTLVQGSEGRNSIRGFPLVQIDLALRRQFNLTEHVNLQFRAEGFNVVNRPNFGNPLNNIGTCAQGVRCMPVFGWGTSQAMLNQSLFSFGFYGSGFGSLYQIGGPRSLQLSMKLQF